MIVGIDHIGLATDDPVGVAPFLTALGLCQAARGVADAYAVACEFWHHPGAAGAPSLELVSPNGEDSAISARLARHGPGLYHVAFEVDGLESELVRLTQAGFVAVDQAPRAGAKPGMRVSFLYLRKPAGLLIELVEYG
jgi:methylmalonyl-CoA/ethylmalonyl-CoA epimerase